MSIESSVVFEEKVGLTARDFGNPKIDIQKMILGKIAQKLEGKCSVHGWVKPRTLKILSRSMGYVEKGRFTGDIVFHVQAEGKVYNPPSGIEVVGTVTGNNKMGMYVSVEDAIKVILPRDLHIGQEYEEFHNTQIGDKVRVEVKKSRFQVNDEFILSVGLFLGKVGSDYKGPQRDILEENVIEESRLADEAAQRMAKFQEEQAAAERKKEQELFNIIDTLTTKKQELNSEAPLQPAPTVVPPTRNKKPNTTTTTTAKPDLLPVFNNEMPPLIPINYTAINQEFEEAKEARRPLPQGANTAEPYHTDEVEEIPTNFPFDSSFPALFTVDGKDYASIDQFMKVHMYSDPEVQEQIRSKLIVGKKVPNSEITAPVRPDWNNVKEDLMYKAITAKFEQNPNMKKQLEASYPKKLVSASTDPYWGKGRTGKGKNRLGFLLMKYRGSLPQFRSTMENVD